MPAQSSKGTDEAELWGEAGRTLRTLPFSERPEASDVRYCGCVGSPFLEYFSNQYRR